MPTGDNVTYVSGTGHRPLPHADDLLYRRAHAPVTRKPAGLDWSALTRACTSCGEKSTELVDSACPVCRGVVPAKKKARTAKAETYVELPAEDLEARFTAPTRPAHRKTITVATPDFPTYIVDAAVVMRDSENHPDPHVRAARKTVANALVGLNRELLRYGDASSIPAPAPTRLDIPAPVAPSGVTLADLGVTSRQVKDWALAQGLITEINVGRPPGRLIDAYAAAHTSPTGATA